MEEIQKFSDYASKYNVNQDYSALFSGMNASKTTSTGFDFAEYGMIQKGAYRKLVKTYYAQQDTEKAGGSNTSRNAGTKQKTLLKRSADTLRESAEALQDNSLWEKKKITVKDEKNGEETTKLDYDWDAISKAVNAFVTDYNDVIEEAGSSEERDVLRQTLWMVQGTDKSENILKRAGISIGKDNKLTVDEEKLKKADIGALKTLFTGQVSFASKVAQRAARMSQSTLNTSGTYTSAGTYQCSKTLSKLLEGKVNEEV